MPEPIAVAFVEVRPDTSSFATQTESDVKQSLAATGEVEQALQKVKQVDLSGTFTPVTTGAQSATAEISQLASAAASVPANLGSDLGAGLDDATSGTAELAAQTAGLGDTLGTSATAAGTLLQASQRLVGTESALAAATGAEATAARTATVEEGKLARVRARRASSVGPLRLAGIGVGAGIAIFAVTQVLGELSSQLRVTGNDATSVEGRFRNLGASLLSGDVIGAFKALSTSAHDFSVAELEVVENSPQLLADLKAIGQQGNIAKSQLKGLESLTKIPAALELSVTEAEFSGNDKSQIEALRAADQAVQDQIKTARAIGVGSAGLAVALNELIKKRIAIRGAISQVTDRQRASLLAPLVEAVTDARLSGDARKIAVALSSERAILQAVLIPLAGSATERKQFKDQLVSINQEIEQIQTDIQAEVDRHHAEMISLALQPTEEAVTNAEISGSQGAELAALASRKAVLALLIVAELDFDARQALKNELISVNSRVEGIQSEIAAEAKRHAEEMKAAREKARQAVLDALGLRELKLETALERAELDGSLRLQRAALQRKLAFYSEEIRMFGLDSAAGQQAAQARIATQARLRALNHDAIMDQIATQEDRLKDNVTLAGFTEKVKTDDEKALRQLIAFERKQAHNRQLSIAERRKHLIEQKQAEKDLRELTKKDDGQSFAKLSFDFLKTQKGFAANLAGNLLGNTSGLVGGTTVPTPSVPPLTIGETRTERPLPTGQALSATATRDAGGRAPSSTQLETLILLARQQLEEMKLLRSGNAHPEAHVSRSLGHHVVETSPA